MIRTKDFLVFILAVVFLFLGIANTVDFGQENSWWSGLGLVANVGEYEAVVPERVVMDKAKNLQDMRDKVSESNLLSLAVSEEEQAKVKEDESTDEGVDEVMVGEIKKCANYSNYTPVWSPAGLKFEVVEGARIVYRDKALELASSSSLDISEREVVLQLPLRVTPAGSGNCLNSSIIGIALDGSLIANDNYSAYKIFGGETLIGYALDGFPIYGLNDSVETDKCGGVYDGQYRYYLSSKREGMIGCFAGEAVSL